MSIDLSIVLPAYNEADCLPEVIGEVWSILPSLDYRTEVVVVDDGSTDGTDVVLRDLATQYAALRIVSLNGNQGQSAAFLAGFRAARGTLLVTMDADGQNDPGAILDLLDGLAEADCVVGYRADRKDIWSKRWGSKLANLVRSWVLRDGIRDTGCTLKAFPRELTTNLPAWNGIHRFFPAFFLMQGATLHQLPVRHRARFAGTSKYTNFGRLGRTVRDLFGVRWLMSRYLRIEPH